MSHPGSIYLDKIDFTKLNFLTSSYETKITSDNFNLETGKPKTNIKNNSKVNSFFLDSISKNLFERKNVNNNLIYTYPKLLETTALRDMQVTNETTIDAIFVNEGASMKNMFGYYMYTVDEDGTKHLLGNAENTEGYYYEPTIIFPHVYSIEGNHNTIQQGDARRLKGNLPNGNFENIYIGLFLIPHGWFAYENNSPIDNTAIFYSTIEFNHKYNASEFEMVNEKIYSIYFKASYNDTEELLLTGFEDIFVEGTDDLDYNDCVVGFEISDVKNIVDYEHYTKVEIINELIRNNIIFIDEDGEYLYIDRNRFSIPQLNTIFERHYICDSLTTQTDLFNALKSLLLNYKLDTSIDNSFGQYKIICKYLFRRNDLINRSNDDDNDKNDNGYKSKKIFLFESKFNRHKNNDIEFYKSTLSKFYNNPNCSEKYRLYEADTEDEIIKLTDLIDSPQKQSEDTFRIIGNGVMDCVNGKSHLPSSDVQFYNVYGNYNDKLNITINVKMDDHPTGFMLNKKTFVRYITFIVNDEYVTIDLGTLDLYTEIDYELVLNNSLDLKNIKISDIQRNPDHIKEVINVFKNDKQSFYRTVTLNDKMVFYCIRLPSVKNNPTIVYLEPSTFFNWNDKYNRVTGTYYNKQKIYPLEGFLHIL